MTIQEIVQQRNITKLFHFTHSDNLASIIESGLLSRSDLDAEGDDYSFNDSERIDGHLDAICLSVSFPNAKMFYKCRMLKPGNWVILEIDLQFYGIRIVHFILRMQLQIMFVSMILS